MTNKALIRGSCQGNVECFLYKTALQSSFDFKQKTVRCGVAIQYNRPCEGRRLPGTLFCNYKRCGLPGFKEKNDGIPVFFLCFLLGVFWGTTSCHIRYSTRKIGGLSRCSFLLLRVFFFQVHSPWVVGSGPKSVTISTYIFSTSRLLNISNPGFVRNPSWDETNPNKTSWSGRT